MRLLLLGSPPSFVSLPILFAMQEAFLKGAIKVDGKAGNLAGKVEVKREGGKIVVESTTSFAKRYFKYLTKKYLKKQSLRDYLRVIANSKVGYELRYFKMASEEGEEEEK